LYPSSASNFSSALAIVAVLCFRAPEDIDAKAEGRDYVARFHLLYYNGRPQAEEIGESEKHSRRNKKPHGVLME
jgi:hypothetical protein